MTSIENIFNLLNYEIIKKIVLDSELDNFIDINKIPKNLADNYFLNCMNIINLKPKLLEQFVKESIDYTETRYHKENLITHLYCVGWICSLISEKFELNSEYAFRLGFFHDIGKPWAKKYIQTKKKLISNSKGHAQIGENIANELGIEQEICWCISNHMCSCCHENNSNSHWEYVGSLHTISLPNSKTYFEDNSLYFRSLACLMIGDDLGRLGDVEKNYPNIFAHSSEWYEWIKLYLDKPNPISHSVKFLNKLHPDNTILVQMYGHSGFGKSTTVQKLINKLNEFGISWDLAERDKSYYNVYSQETNTDFNDNIKNLEYKIVYDWIEQNDLKTKVQQDWVNQLNSILDSDSRVKIIDSVQILYPKAWESTLKSLDTDCFSVWASSIKFGFYGFPQSLYGHEFEPKTGKYELIPREPTNGLTWPNLNSELDKSESFNPNLVDIAYGSIYFLINSIRNYYSWSILQAPSQQIHLIKILDQIDKIKHSVKLSSKLIRDYIQNQFPPGVITSGDELSYYSFHLIRFGYKDGMQIFNGPSRDYRGDTLLFDEFSQLYYIGRVSLPVFPDYSDIRKDPGAQELINTCTSFHIVPKFDGSLFVLALVKSNTPEFDIILSLLNQVSAKSWVKNHLGIWCFGSKSCMFAKDQFGDHGVLSTIINSIEASYNTIDNFICLVSKEVESQDMLKYSNISLIFEAIDLIPNSCLTVDYGRAFCPFLCWVIWDGNKKKIIKPEKNLIFLYPVAQPTIVNTWEEVIQFKKQAHSRLLEGSQIDEPEGYVVWLGDSNIGIKLKHPEYYIAHKPYSKKNAHMAKHIEFSDEYAKLRTRLVNFKPKPPILNLLGNLTDKIVELFLDNFEYLKSRKDWACYWKNNSDKINVILEIMESNVTIYYPQFKNSLKDKGFTICMDYFDKRDNWKEYFLSKYLK